jgi:hypothetical protein
LKPLPRKSNFTIEGSFAYVEPLIVRFVDGSRSLLPEGFQSPKSHIFSPTIAQNVKIVVIGSDSKIAVAGTVPLVGHFLNFKAPTPQKKA